MTKVDYGALTMSAMKIKDDLLRAGLLKSYRAMDGVTQTLGWEIGEKFGDPPDLKRKYDTAKERAERRARRGLRP